jgi:uncharacterized protein
VTSSEIISKLKAEHQLLKNFHVEAVYIFGSHARGEAYTASDVDLLVDFEPTARVGIFEFLRLQRALSQKLGVSVDIVTRDALHPALKDRILAEAVHVA